MLQASYAVSLRRRLSIDNTAIDVAVNGAFFSTGQRCTASSRLIITEGIYEQFVDAWVKRTKSLVVDNAMKSGAQIGPLASAQQLALDLDYIQIGRGEGATLLCGGEQVERETDGYYLTPAIFVYSKQSIRISREEIFGPVSSVIRVQDYDEASAVANDTEFGLSSGIVT